MQKKTIIAFLGLVVSAGCAKQPQKTSYNPLSSPRSAAIAQRSENLGVMSSEDYLHWEELGAKLEAKQNLDDADVDWAIATMKKPSTKAWIVNANMTGLFASMKTFTPSQREKIRAAVTPLLTSKEALDRKCAKGVIQHIDQT